MRSLLTAVIAWLMTGSAAQEAGHAPASTPAAPSTTAARLCGGDGAVAAVPSLLPGYGSGGFHVDTKVPEAQAFFDNGMQLGAAFAHKAAIAAMREAVRLDPGCAMCAWGEAWARGPTINYPIRAGELVKAGELTATAEKLAVGASARDKALIAALRQRYGPPQKGRTTNDLAFATAMDAIAREHPADNAVATLAADAWMVASDEKTEVRFLARSVELLEGVLARDPDYTPAIHFYIHATEGAKVPARATRYADALGALAPKSSHLVHMPSHTYYWIGRYQDAADVNARAVELGIENAKRLGMKPDGVWDLPYHAHNIHFGVGGAMMSGDAAKALALSGPMLRVAALRESGPVFAQAIAGMGYAAEGRFADPAAVLALPEPKLPYMKAFWHYARGEAQARQGDSGAVRREAAAILAGLKGKSRLDDKMGAKLVEIARLVLVGRAAMLEKRTDEAKRAFAAAAKLEEGKLIGRYSDPPLWWYPPRRSLAEARLMGGDAKGALAEAEMTLRRRPHDPMTLAVRAKAQATLGVKASASRDAKAALAGWRGERRAFAPHLI